MNRKRKTKQIYIEQRGWKERERENPKEIYVK